MIHVQGHKVKYQTATTPQRIARFRSNMVQSLTIAQPADYKCSRSKVKGQGNEVMTFLGNQLRGFDSVRGRILQFSYLQAVAINTVLALRGACDKTHRVNNTVAAFLATA